MQIIQKDLPNSRVRLSISLSVEEMAPYFTAAIREVGKTIVIPGFRPGKAPDSVVRQFAGSARIIEVATERAAAAAYQSALTERGLVALDEPVVEVVEVGEGKPFTMTAEVDVLPTVTVPNLNSICVNPKQYQPEPVTDSDVDEALTNVRRRFGQLKSVNRPAAVGDWVEVSYVGTVDGINQENLKSDHHPVILGSGTFLPAFEEQLVGMEAGQQRTFTIDVPRNGNNPQPVQFTVTMESISEFSLPPLDDSLAKQVGKDSVEDLRKAIRDDLTHHREAAARARLEEAVLVAVAKKAKLDLPKVLVERESARRMSNLIDQLKAGGRTLEAWLKTQKKDLSAVQAEVREAATTAVTISLLLRAIAEQEGLIKAGERATDESMQKTVSLVVERVTGKAR